MAPKRSPMGERGVVTVFLEHESEVLLCRRSDAVGSYAGRWGAVAGHVEDDDPEAAARREIREETGLEDDQVTFRRRGEPFTVTDAELGVRWRVHPFRFGAQTRAIEPNWEAVTCEWVHPPAILERETVPDLWASWDRVRPTIDSVVEDTVHGSAHVSLAALEVLRDEAAMLEDDGSWAQIAAIAADLRSARSSMAVVRVRIDQVMATASEEHTPAAVRDAAIECLGRARAADAAAARRAADLIDGAVVFTLSRSGTVEQALQEGNPAAVSVAESRPGGEGRDLAAAIAEDTPVTVVQDASIPAAVRDADLVLVGADTVFRNGDVLNKTGTLAAAVAADWAEVPFYAVTATDKITPETEWTAMGGGEDGGQSPAGVTEIAPTFERTPAPLVTAVVTETGHLDAAAVEAVADRHATAAEWMANR